MRNLTITNLAVDEIRPNPRNPRTHSAKQVRQIAASIREFGFTSPILIDEANEIIAGHGRLEAARSVGLIEVPCICLTGLTSAQKQALVIADNKLALNAGWLTRRQPVETQCTLLQPQHNCPKRPELSQNISESV